MAKTISIRCGIDKCEHYKACEVSACGIYSDRQECQKSMKNRSKNRNHSRRRELNSMYY